MVHGTRSIGYTQSVVFVASYRHILYNGDDVTFLKSSSLQFRSRFGLHFTINGNRRESSG